MQRRLFITDLPIKDQKVLMRVDFNVPLDKSAIIKDDTRIRESLPSIRHILDQGGSVILMSHLGRPDGKANSELSLMPVAKHLSELLKKPVLFAKDCVGDEAKALAGSLKPGHVLLLENLRFHPAEEKPKLDPEFAKTLASLGTLYVNDAFGTAHRAHSSTASVPKYFEGKAAAGFLLEKEIRFLGGILENPKRPLIAIIGGAKISTKIGVLKALLKKVDALLIGGGMAYTFMKAKGMPVGNSLLEEGFEKEALSIIAEAKRLGVPLLLPLDNLAADAVSNPKEIKLVQGGIPNGFCGVDIGPKTIALFKEEIAGAHTVFWNGPLGIFEDKRFAEGTKEIALAVAKRPVSIVGGGDSVAAVNETGVAGKITHISTGGGAALEFIEHGSLPGIEALTLKKKHNFVLEKNDV